MDVMHTMSNGYRQVCRLIMIWTAVIRIVVMRKLKIDRIAIRNGISIIILVSFLDLKSLLRMPINTNLVKLSNKK